MPVPKPVDRVGEAGAEDGVEKRSDVLSRWQIEQRLR